MSAQASTANEVTSGVRETVDRAAQSAHETIDRLAAKATPTLEQLQSAATGTAQSLQDKADAMTAMEKAWIESARKIVREHPLATVAVAIAAGMLISRIGGR